jgi:glucosamine-6-phosphate deaminase
METLSKRALLEWCAIPAAELVDHPARRIPFRMVADSTEMGRVMAEELVEAVVEARREDRGLRVILPCGPMAWMAPFARIINERSLSLHDLEVFHMDECLDWQGREIDRDHPYSFRGTMEREFYGALDEALRPALELRHWLTPETYLDMSTELIANPADLAYGGWGQDGHVAYNQTRRNPFSELTVDDLRNSTARIQDNNVDTIIALSQRTLGGAYQFVPPMSVTLGMREILAARRVRLFSDTGAWKQTALRVALFGQPTPEYPVTLLQDHPDAMLTATTATAEHAISLNPQWVTAL